MHYRKAREQRTSLTIGLAIFTDINLKYFPFISQWLFENNITLFIWVRWAGIYIETAIISIIEKVFIYIFQQSSLLIYYSKVVELLITFIKHYAVKTSDHNPVNKFGYRILDSPLYIIKCIFTFSIFLFGPDS